MLESPNGKRSHGNNFFFCGKRLVFGPDVRNLLLTLILIIAPMVVFFILVGRQLMKNFPHQWGNAIMVVAVVNTFVVLITLLLTAAQDPGIIPRNHNKVSMELSPEVHTKKPIDENVNGKIVRRKYCETCHHHRPLRCSHCSICNNCIDRFDHHCPWTGQCIGRRNYPFYYLFISTSTLLCFFVISMCALRIKKLMDGDPPHTVWKAFQRSPASVFLMAYCFLASWFVGGLTVFHTYLISTNQTTYENFRYRYYDSDGNPFNKGIIYNFWEVFCSGIPPSKIIDKPQYDKDIGNRTTVDDNKHAHGGDIELGRKRNLEGIGFSQSDEGLRSEVKNGHVYPLPKDIQPHSNNVYYSERSSWNKEISREVLHGPSDNSPEEESNR